MLYHQEIISIPEYYAGQSIFITGGTGLMGKVLIEKILRCCPDVATVYVLIRPKRKMSIEERWSKITQLPLFEKLKSERPEALQKVFLLQGDIRETFLGLSERNLKILTDHVTLVFHTAAMVQFTDSMVDALLQNVKGTCRVLELAKSMIKLKAFIHISTAYSNSDKLSEEAVEEVLPACQDWKVVLKILENYPLELEALKEKLLCGHPNPYTWSKSLAEQAVHSFNEYFPIIIIRPSIVCGAVEDPLPGWVDAVNGLSGISWACGCGLLRVLPTSPDNSLDQVPVDYAIRACLIAPWKLHIKFKSSSKGDENDQRKTTEVYNGAYAKNFTNEFTFKYFEKLGIELLEQYPSSHAVWVPSVTYTKDNSVLYSFLFLIYQVVPSVLADFVLNVLKKKPRAIKLTIRTANAFRLIGKLLNERIAFPNEKFLSLGQCVKEEDKEAFSYPTFLDGMDDIFRRLTQGMRIYVWKDDISEEAMEKNRKFMDRIKLLHKIIKGSTYLTAVYCLYIYMRLYF